MDLKKRKHFTLKTEGSFLVSLFLCFSLQTIKYSALVELFNAAIWRFFKNYSKFCKETPLMETIIPLDDDIVWCKNAIAFKYIAKSCGFFLLGAPKYLLAAKLFYSLFAQRSSLPLVIRGRSGAPATSKMERFETIVNSWKPLTIISKRSILDVAGALDPPLVILDILLRNNSYLLGVRFLINNRVTTGPSWKLGKKRVFFPNRTWTQKNETFG